MWTSNIFVIPRASCGRVMLTLKLNMGLEIHLTLIVSINIAYFSEISEMDNNYKFYSLIYVIY